MLVLAELADRIERAIWSPAATAAEIANLCDDSKAQRIRAVCVAGSRVALAAARLEDSPVKSVALIGFPLGNADSDVKRYETEAALDCGAQEIELTFNHGLLRDGDAQAVLRELRDVTEAADERPVCVVLEVSKLTRDETILACHLVLDSGATGIGAGSNFWPGAHATANQIALLREAVGSSFIIKAPVDISDRAATQALVSAGATRLGLA